jgi:hypothetical protein
LSVSVRECCHGRCPGAGWYRRRSDSHSCDPLACNDVDRPCAGHHLSRSCLLSRRTRPPDGQITKTCRAPCRKIIPLTRRANQFYQFARLTREEGRIAIVTKRGMGCGGRGSAGAQGDRRADPGSVSGSRRADERRCCVRQNRVVPTPVAGAKLSVAKSIQPGRSAVNPSATVTRRIRSPGRSRHKP